MLSPGLIHQDLLGQQTLGPAQVPEAFRDLQQLGDLRLKTYSIHGLAPLVVLLTEAPASAPEVERRYRHAMTSTLLWNIEGIGVSLFSLSPEVDQATQYSGALFDILRRLPPSARPQVFIGFAQGAIAAARMLQSDSSSTALIGLAPSLGASASAPQSAFWQEMVSPANHTRPVLVLESVCNTSGNGLAQVGTGQRVTVLLLPQYDGWLSRRASAACPTTPTHAAGMDYELMSLLTNWLRQTVVFPE